MSREPPMPPSLRRKWQQTSSQSLDSGLRNRLSTITDEDLQTTTEALSTPFDADGSVIPSSISRASPTSTDESASGTPGSISPEQLKDDRCGRGPEVEGNSYRVMPSTLTQATSQAQDRRLAILFLALLVCLTAAQSTFSSLMSFLSSLFLGS
ncbi:hypothetical protein CONPUDRAFT_135484 [Coniophora puteana RWD-64-598 SS2]|uniref:Uncharacterized protein n=1 Tax=Coniophora puteana (strain RWD-64-598) TaxID=741705 RepID=A0A5M3MYN2_CONPW|nr:uncharacterized protein CONPUDRAFT_135484 [Coniophora puteana RWD-64-598 SS2]EIW83755.1 hypothetical protein CONPUDRAFT_135484 [Coniophora puteana RWD-64-598 SS2]